jgi:hypothetical protein
MRRFGLIALAALILLWPAFVNGYPLVFSDTGTYLSQAIHRYLGWDRPVFYSLFIFPLHMQVTTWPIIVVQALLTAHLLYLAQRCLRPYLAGGWLPGFAALLAALTPLPVFVAQLMPDLLTGLMVLALALLVLCQQRLTAKETWWLTGLAGFAMAAHLSNLPIAVGLLIILVPLRGQLGSAAPLGRVGLGQLVLAPAAAALALISVNLVGHRAPALAPYGNVFLLARVLYDGPGFDVLARDCPRPGWRLCGHDVAFPATADGFLWKADSPLYKDGGPKLISAEAGPIIIAAVRAEPFRELRAVLANAGQQLASFGTGDGLQPWPDTVTPWIRRDFPAFERAAYQQARQTAGQSVLPRWLPGLHEAVSLGSIAICVLLLPGALKRRVPMAGIIVAVLLSLLGNALITGGLSGPHDRYQSRVMWLPTLVAVLAIAPSAARNRTSAA